MSSDAAVEIRALRSDELEQAWQLDRDAFHSPDAHRGLFLQVHAASRLVGAFDGRRLLAMCGAHPFGQFFGGRSVPMGGLSSVAVAPDQRGRGLARRVVTARLELMPGDGQAISSLYPAMTRLYRGLGWEAGGSAVWRQVAPRVLEALPQPAGVRVRPGSGDDLDALSACYARVARAVNGFVDRPAHWWEGWRWLWRDRSVFVAETADGQVCGYLVYRQLDGEHSTLGGPFRLAVDDVLWGSRDAGLALWRLLGSWASQVERIHYRSGPEDPLLLLLPEQEIATLAEVRWMTRVVDVEAAIAARGFPAGLSVEVPFALEDPLLPANAGSWLLRVEKGRGRLERTAAEGARFDVGSFSSLYTGWAAPAALARAGRLTGGSPDERAALDAVFAGPTPWMLEEF